MEDSIPNEISDEAKVDVIHTQYNFLEKIIIKNLFFLKHVNYWNR